MGYRKRLSRRLENIGCNNALDFMNLPESWVRNNLSIVELNPTGIKRYFKFKSRVIKVKKSIATTRSFEGLFPIYTN